MPDNDHDLLIRIETTVKLQAIEINRRLEYLEHPPLPNGNGRRVTPRDWLLFGAGGILGGGGGSGLTQLLLGV